MADIAFVTLGLGFLALCGLYVRGLDHIVRSAHQAEGPPPDLVGGPAAPEAEPAALAAGIG